MKSGQHQRGKWTEKNSLHEMMTHIKIIIKKNTHTHTHTHTEILREQPRSGK